MLLQRLYCLPGCHSPPLPLRVLLRSCFSLLHLHLQVFAGLPLLAAVLQTVLYGVRAS
jgi:hypothetical protein